MDSDSSVVRSAGFTLLELMMSMAVLCLAMVILFSITDSTGKVWRSSMDKIGTFQAARTAFESVTRHVSQSTLNTSWDYYNTAGQTRGESGAGFQPSYYGRASELHFVCGQGRQLLPSELQTTTHALFFQAPLGYSQDPAFQGLEDLLCASGYFIQYRDNGMEMPGFVRDRSLVQPKYRYRLMQFLQPSENLKVYLRAPAQSDPCGWFRQPLASPMPSAHTVADNVVAFIVQPMLSRADETTVPLSMDYSYDSRNTASARTLHQLPPLLQITMVAMDETSAIQQGNQLPEVIGDSLGLETSEPLFTQVARFEEELKQLEGTLSGEQIRYRTFHSTVALRAAKWSE